MVGQSSRVYFICWDGAASSRGAFVRELLAPRIANQQLRGLTCDVLPLNPYAIEASTMDFLRFGDADEFALPFTQDPPTRSSMLRRLVSDTNSSVLAGHGSSNVPVEPQDGGDDVVSDAIRSISSDGPMSPYSQREKSVRLLRQVPAWSQLNDSAQNRLRLEDQGKNLFCIRVFILSLSSVHYLMRFFRVFAVPVIYVRFPCEIGSPCLLTLRRTYIDNGVATPFNQILSWLSNNKDYFTAASVALDLLRDAGTLLHLWRSLEKIDDEDGQAKLEGLLDGIIPMSNSIHSVDSTDPAVQTTVTRLADMTIGCLTRGGFSMSSTLEHFLQHDQHYDAARTSLILAAIAAQAVSDDEEATISLMGQKYKAPDDQNQLLHDILWPLRCLLQVGTARKNLSVSLALMNAVVPDELRRRKEHKQVDAMALCIALVRLVIEASTEATEMLLDLVDEQQQKRFWDSLDHETRLDMSLILIGGKRPLLRQLEVRSWAMKYLERSLQKSNTRKIDEIPTQWVRSLCIACLLNAQCKVGPLFSKLDDKTATNHSDDGIKEHVRELTLARDALLAGCDSGGVDFNLLIPALLILQSRKTHWNDDSWVPTQSILNAACDMAGRKTAVEPMFAFDGNTLMKQCFLAQNICAGANLIGGKNGLILECCFILDECCGMSMEDAESFLTRDAMNIENGGSEFSDSEKVADDFTLTNGHRHVLWLLEEHVLGIKTYGEFEAARGKVDPVFAARVCLRTWFSLTKLQLPSASAWLATWLRRQLEISDGIVSGKRLACAVLARVLLWSTGLDEGNVLAEVLHLESQFLVQLSQGCWSLTESVPPSVADKILAQDAADGNCG